MPISGDISVVSKSVLSAADVSRAMSPLAELAEGGALKEVNYVQHDSLVPPGVRVGVAGVLTLPTQEAMLEALGKLAPDWALVRVTWRADNPLDAAKEPQKAA